MNLEQELISLVTDLESDFTETTHKYIEFCKISYKYRNQFQKFVLKGNEWFPKVLGNVYHDAM